MVVPSVRVQTSSLELLSMLRSDRGIALLEVLVALTILSGAGLALLDLVTGGLRAERDARERERVLAVEERVLTAFTLLTRDELDRRLGRHPIGELIVEIQRPERTLYRIAVSQQESSQVEDLVTVVYRREPRNGP
jgi:type II secretory pathway pseudopilin PulG